jgi:cell division protein FtsL
MTKLNFILFVVLILTAMGVILAQHHSRKMTFELQQQNETAKALEAESTQLQLEQGTWAMHSRVEQVATDLLHMHVPDTKQIQVVTAGEK